MVLFSFTKNLNVCFKRFLVLYLPSRSFLYYCQLHHTTKVTSKSIMLVGLLLLVICLDSISWNTHNSILLLVIWRIIPWGRVLRKCLFRIRTFYKKNSSEECGKYILSKHINKRSIDMTFVKLILYIKYGWRLYQTFLKIGY